MAAAVQEVDRAFSADHTALERLRERARTSALRTDLTNADNQLKQLRQSAVQAIHATSTCAKTEDQDSEDKDNEDADEHTALASPTVAPSASPTVAPTASATTAPSSSPLVTGNDPKTIADNAVAAMKVVFDSIVAEFPSTSASPRPSATFGHDKRGASGEHD